MLRRLIRLSAQDEAAVVAGDASLKYSRISHFWR
jgi:hypothetical protein